MAKKITNSAGTERTIPLPGPLNTLAATAKDTARALRYRVLQTAEELAQHGDSMAPSTLLSAARLAKTVMTKAEGLAEDVFVPGRSSRHLVLQLQPPSQFFIKQLPEAQHQFVRYHYALIKRLLQYCGAANSLVFEQTLIVVFDQLVEWCLQRNVRDTEEGRVWITTCLALCLFRSPPIQEAVFDSECRDFVIRENLAEFLVLFVALAGLVAEANVAPMSLESELPLLAAVAQAELALFSENLRTMPIENSHALADSLVRMAGHLI